MQIKLMLHKEMVASCRMAIFAMTIFAKQSQSLHSKFMEMASMSGINDFLNSVECCHKKTQSTKRCPELGFPKNQFNWSTKLLLITFAGNCDTVRRLLQDETGAAIFSTCISCASRVEPFSESYNWLLLVGISCYYYD